MTRPQSQFAWRLVAQCLAMLLVGMAMAAAAHAQTPGAQAPADEEPITPVLAPPAADPRKLALGERRASSMLSPLMQGFERRPTGNDRSEPRRKALNRAHRVSGTGSSNPFPSTGHSAGKLTSFPWHPRSDPEAQWWKWNLPTEGFCFGRVLIEPDDRPRSAGVVVGEDAAGGRW